VFKAEEPPYFLYRKYGRSGKEKGEDILALLRRILEDIRSLQG
jgi:transcription-repair coupling factor (superfamily II helicase)